MGYKNKLPYQLHGERWKKFEGELNSIADYLDKVQYDGFTKNSHKSESEVTKYPAYCIDQDIESIESKIFSLPKNYPLKSLDEVFEFITSPNLPTPPTPPSLNFDGEYPDWYLQYVEKENSDRNKLIEQLKKLKIELEIKKNKFLEILKEKINNAQSIKSGITLLNPDKTANENLIILAHKSHPLPQFLKKEFICKISTESRIAIIQFEFPDYSNESIVAGYKKVKYTAVPKFLSDAQKKKLIKICLYSLIIRIGVITAKFNLCNFFDSVVINVEQHWFDPATGQPRDGVIATLQASTEYLNSLDLSKLDPESCFKTLKGIATPNIQNISPVRPIFILNKEDERFVESKKIEIDQESNLAAMPWEDFEHLVAQLFEWEFAKSGVEVKVTRASRDRGVDAILFDPDPLKGGKFVLQAKRYTRTVDVSAVRDLYGTVMNEGANRGIIITTSSYGPDAYEFAKDKPISLVDGQNLLLLLQKHGQKFRIDLEEARFLNLNNE